MKAKITGYTTIWEVVNTFTNKAEIECVTLLHPNKKQYTVQRKADCVFI